MSLNIGIVGLPNVGKSTIFNALTLAGAKVESFPFCTIDPNHGVVPLPDRRLDQLRQLLSPPRVTPATLEVVDIAGLVKGAHRGEGLGNQFLGHLREVDALIHVLRCFGGDIAHVDGAVEPCRDLAVVELELVLADLATVEQRLDKIRRQVLVGVKEAKLEQPVLSRLAETLRDGSPLRARQPDEQEAQLARSYGLLTAKPVLYAANVDEAQLRQPDALLGALQQQVEAGGQSLVVLCGQLEAEIALLSDALEQAMFLEDLGLSESGLHRLARRAYRLLGLIDFYTFVGGKELRAWSVPAGTPAPQAAGKIHTDFERGFIRAEVAAFDDYVRHGGEAGVRQQGLLRSEGKDYVIQDGDVVHFRFNV